MSYVAPVADLAFALRHAAGLGADLDAGLHGELSFDLVKTVLAEAGRFGAERLAPLNRVGDVEGATLENGVVRTATGWREAYRDWAAAGWNGLSAPETHGGQGLPVSLNMAAHEIWNAACMSLALCPMLTLGAIEALERHGSPEVQARYLGPLVAGTWTGTMNLTESQAGSDLSAVRARAEPQGDGSYRVSGTKIYITYGEHDMTENILHLVLARLPDAPAGTRGISLFLVPKYAVNDDGSLGARNALRCTGLEEKLGIHASPTCTMAYGDGGGATGYLIGEENRGLACMFTMMNAARLAVGVQGVGIAERATQAALAYARERRQGKAMGQETPGMTPIIAHPDVARTLMTMRALTASARAICLVCAAELDRSRLAATPEARAAADARAGLLTPVAKAFGSETGVEVANLGLGVHGGMGYVEETGAAQYLRDARIAPIYEGTNGIQAIDLVMRKLPQGEGATVRGAIGAMRAVAGRLVNAPGSFGQSAPRLREAVESLDRATSHLLAVACKAPHEALAAATPYLRLYALAQGGALLAKVALAAEAARAGGDDDPAHPGRIALARFFLEQLAVAAPGLEAAVLGAGEALRAADLALAS